MKIEKSDTVKKLKRFHAIHHQLRKQSPLSSWSIHPVEGIIDAFGIIILGLFFPAPLEVFCVYAVFAFQINIWAHFTLKPNDHSILKNFINIAGNFHHHDIHHYNPNKNYGAFVLLDKFLKTQTKLYPSQYETK